MAVLSLRFSRFFTVYSKKGVRNTDFTESKYIKRECVFNRHSEFENGFKKQERNFFLWGNDRLMESDQFRKRGFVESEGKEFFRLSSIIKLKHLEFLSMKI